LKRGGRRWAEGGVEERKGEEKGREEEEKREEKRLEGGERIDFSKPVAAKGGTGEESENFKKR
jgi:hypothetical protein